MLHVIEGGSEEAFVERRPRPRFSLDTTSRRVYCGKCEQELDAFTALETLAGMFERVNSRYQAARNEAERVEARLEELKRQERNAKARVRRAS